MKLNKKFVAVPAVAFAAGLSLAACGSVQAPVAAAPATHSVAGARTEPAPAKTTPAAAPAPTQVAALPTVTTNNAITPGAQAVQPSAIYFSADGNGDLTRITWSSWTAHSAKGSGSINVNNCQPDCARGTTVNVPVSVALSAPTSGSSPHFTAITLTDSSGHTNTYAACSARPNEKHIERHVHRRYATGFRAYGPIRRIACGRVVPRWFPRHRVWAADLRDQRAEHQLPATISWLWLHHRY